MEQQENTPGSRQDTHVFHASGTETGGVAGAETGPGGVAGVGAAEGAAGGDSGCADGFTGMLSLQNLDALDHTAAAHVPTEHSNLANLCPKHHRYKTLGHWKATQPEPGILEWTSPTGRTYRTEPQLHLQPRQTHRIAQEEQKPPF